MEKILTIIIPSYNMEKYLERCLSSLIVSPERMPLFEAIVVNDGSKDRTSEIGHSFASRYPDTFRVIDKENGHYGSCVNRGLSEARGVFVKILDADDTFDPTVFGPYLDYLVKMARIDDADLVLSEYVQVDDNLVLLSEHLYDDYPEPFTLGDLSGLDVLRWFIHGLTYRTSLLRDNGYRQTEGVAYTDLEWGFFPAAFVRYAYRFHGFLYRYTKMREEQSVAPAVHGKNIGMQIRVVEGIVRKSSEILAHCRADNKRFLEQLMQLDVINIYQLVLLTLHRHVESDSLLSSFDRMLLDSNPELYKSTGDYCTAIGPFHIRPIRLWRVGRHLRLKAAQTLYTLSEYKSNHYRRIKTKAE